MTFKRVDKTILEVACWLDVVRYIDESYAEIDRLISVIDSQNSRYDQQRSVNERLCSDLNHKEQALLYAQNEIERLRELVGQQPFDEPLPTWVPPRSMPSGKFEFESRRKIWIFHPAKFHERCQRGHWEQQWDYSYSDWTDPPCVGTWEVTAPGVAVFRGEK